MTEGGEEGFLVHGPRGWMFCSQSPISRVRVCIVCSNPLLREYEEDAIVSPRLVLTFSRLSRLVSEVCASLRLHTSRRLHMLLIERPLGRSVDRRLRQQMLPHRPLRNEPIPWLWMSRSPAGDTSGFATLVFRIAPFGHIFHWLQRPQCMGNGTLG